MAITDPSGEIEAFLTDAARNYIARAINGEVSIHVVGFSAGRGGYNPADPVADVTPVNTADTALIDQVYPDTTGNAALETPEEPNFSTIVYNCRLAATPIADNSDFGLGEIGLWAEVVYAVNPMEIGTVFLYAISHMPVRAKTRRDVQLYRLVTNY